MKGPCGAVYAEIIEAHDLFNDLMPEMPWGITDDPRTKPSDATVAELVEIRDKIRQANTLLEGIIEREARYSLDKGWQLPAGGAE